MQRVETKITQNENLKYQITLQCQASLSSADLKELQKVEAFKEHTLALQRHMENTSNYLVKEVDTVELKIEEAKQMLMRELNLNILDFSCETAENRMIEKEIREVEEDEELDEEDEIQFRSGRLEN